MSTPSTIDTERIRLAVGRMEAPLFVLSSFQSLNIEDPDHAAIIVASLGRELLAYLDAVQNELGILQVGSPFEADTLAEDLDKRFCGE